MLNVQFQPFPELTTDRLLLRQLTREDIPEVFFLRSDPAVMQYVNREPAVTYKEVEDFIDRINGAIAANESVLWGMALKEKPGVIIGNICIWQFRKEDFRAEIGYVLHPEYWRKGYMKEAVNRVVQYAFETVKLHSLEAHISPDNIGSAGVLESTGFVKEGHLKDNIRFRDQYGDTIIYSRLNDHD